MPVMTRITTRLYRQSTCCPWSSSSKKVTRLDRAFRSLRMTVPPLSREEVPRYIDVWFVAEQVGIARFLGVFPQCRGLFSQDLVQPLEVGGLPGVDLLGGEVEDGGLEGEDVRLLHHAGQRLPGAEQVVRLHVELAGQGGAQAADERVATVAD